MTTIQLRSRALILLGTGISSIGCRGEASSETTSTSSPDPTQISSLETQLSAARDSLTEARSKTRACFADFRDCREATAGGGTDCQDALKACLPGAIPDADPCAPTSFGTAGTPIAPPPGLGFWSPWGGSMNAGPFGFRPPAADAGSAVNCDDLPKPPAPLSKCRDSIDAGMARRLDPTAIGQEFQACLGDAFGDLIEGVCERIDAECGRAAAPQHICDRLAELCNDPASSP